MREPHRVTVVSGIAQIVFIEIILYACVSLAPFALPVIKEIFVLFIGNQGEALYLNQRDAPFASVSIL